MTSIQGVTAIGDVVAKTLRRASWVVRDRFPHRKVVREVQGVRLVLPWAHRLPDYAGPGSPYGQNLVELARLLAEAAPPLTVLDVGANVGDSAVQILHATDGAVLCVEGDKAYLEYLRINAGDDDRITIVESLLAVDELEGATTAVRTGGTTRFTQGDGADAMPSIRPDDLRDAHPDFADLRLVKSDTDGYDVALVPGIAAAWQASRPVLFFEYDPYLTRIAGLDPLAVWARLEALGYHDIAVWNHAGAPVGRSTTGDIARHVPVLDDFPQRRPGRRSYWDVAVVHRDDDAGRGVLDRMIPSAQVL